MSVPRSSIIVAVCTRSRVPELTRLLATLEVQDWAEGSHLLIVDNDPSGSAADAVRQAAARFPAPIEYIGEMRPGFATVRNAALDRIPKEYAICFLDDDAVVPPDWLEVMWKASITHPGALVRARYAFVRDLPSAPPQIEKAVRELPNVESLGPAGTSGLLIPMEALGPIRFDPYYDESGGEDLDLLLRLAEAGVTEVVADTVVLEQVRQGGSSRDEKWKLARWNGRLEVIIRQRAGMPTWPLRLQALREALWASVRWSVALAVRKRAAATGFRGLATGRWAALTAPRRSPSSLGHRPSQ